MNGKAGLVVGTAGHGPRRAARACPSVVRVKPRWIAVAGLLTACRCGPAPVAAPAPAPAARSAPEGTAADVIGINEAVTLPSRLLPRMSAEERDAAITKRIEAVRALGVRHVRVHSATPPYLSFRDGAFVGYDLADVFLVRILEAGLEPVVVVGPWPGNAPAKETDHYVPSDMEAYRSWVRETVERYDGDGVGDAPGLPRGVNAWEADNEPDLHNAVPPRGGGASVAPEDFETPEEYVRVAVATAEAIREADPDALILPAGLYAPHQPRHAPYADAIWASPELRAAFPVANIHGYAGLPALWRGLDHVSEIAEGRPVWITETSTSSKERGERGQAADLATVFLEALRRGVPRVYWHSLWEAPERASGNPGAPVGTVGHHLLEAEGVRWKLSAYTLRELATRWKDVPRADVTGIPATGGFALRVGADVYAWSDAGTEVVVELEDGPVTVWSLVPADADGGAITGEPQWTGTPSRVTGKRLSVDVSGGPVRIAPEGDP